MVDNLVIRANDLALLLQDTPKIIKTALYKMRFWMDQWALVLFYIKRPKGSIKEMPDVMKHIMAMDYEGISSKYLEYKKNHPSEQVSKYEYDSELYDELITYFNNRFTYIVGASDHLDRNLKRLIIKAREVDLEINDIRRNTRSDIKAIRRVSTRRQHILLQLKIDYSNEYITEVGEFESKVNGLYIDKAWDGELFTKVYLEWYNNKCSLQ